MTPKLPTIDQSLLLPAMCLRPIDPDDHRNFQWLLPQCNPLLFFRDQEGSRWLRWAIPIDVARSIGYHAGCECCGSLTQQVSENHVLVDTLWGEVAWFFEDVTGKEPVRER